uniref:Uncharacterized protein n=1 Tax=Oxytricha trifallax TaxID=1172189 RepID=G9HRD2_9SPIT|nr:hypothetical protein [Oxytricha trifallax]
MFFFLYNTKILNNYFNLITLFSFKNLTPLLNHSNNLSSNLNNSKWNLESLSVENFKNNSLIRNKFGNFFLNDLSFFELSKTLVADNNIFLFKNLIIKNSLNSSINFSKWNRWLYRYSLLHRKSVKFSQKLTFTKRLMNSGFYNSSIFKKNLWNSVYFNSKKLNSSQVTTFFDSYFNGFFIDQNLKFSNSLASNSFLLNNKDNFLFF